MKKILAMAAVAAILAGCGGGGSGGTGEITVWAMGAEGENLPTLAEKFMDENPDITINVEPQAWDVAHDKLLTSVAGGQSPDVSLMGTTWMGEFASIGALAEAPESIEQNAFFESTWDTVMVDGTAYGVPWYSDTRLLYYRTDIAEKAGITEPPETWEELDAMARAMQSEGGAKYGISLLPDNWQELLPFVWQNGGEVYTEGGGFSFEDPEFVEALAFYRSFFEDGVAADNVPQGFDVTQGFVAGTHPMFFSGPWHLALIEDQGGEEMEGKWDVAMMPEKENRTSFVGGGDLVVFEDSEEKEAAWKFVEYLSRPDVQAEWFELTGAVPTVEAAWDELGDDEKLALFGEQLEEAEAPPTIPEWEEVAAEAINTEMEKAVLGEISPEEAAAAMQEKADGIVE